jgi:hypothetical protein
MIRGMGVDSSRRTSISPRSTSSKKSSTSSSSAPVWAPWIASASLAKICRTSSTRCGSSNRSRRAPVSQWATRGRDRRISPASSPQPLLAGLRPARQLRRPGHARLRRRLGRRRLENHRRAHRQRLLALLLGRLERPAHDGPQQHRAHHRPPATSTCAKSPKSRSAIPKHAVIASLMVESKREAWHDIVKRSEDAGADGLELNFGCPTA